MKQKKKTPLQKLKATFAFGSGDGGSNDNGARAGPKWDESGLVSPPITPRAPLVSQQQQQQQRRLQQTAARAASPQPVNNAVTPRISNSDLQQRQLQQLYLAQRADSPRLASRDVESQRPPPTLTSHDESTGKDEYDDELGRELRRAVVEDRRGWEERERTRMDRRWQLPHGHNLQNQQQEQQTNRRQHSQQQQQQQQQESNSTHYAPQPTILPTTNNLPPRPIIKTENSTQSTRSETSSEERSQNSHNNPAYDDSYWQQSNDVMATVDLRKVRHRERLSSRKMHNHFAKSDAHHHDLPRQSEDEKQQPHLKDSNAKNQSKSMNYRRQATPPPSNLGSIHEERPTGIEHDIQSSFWDNNNNGQFHQVDDNFNPDDENDAVLTGNMPRNNSIPNYRNRKPSNLTIDVVSDVSYHDDPSIGMMSSLADTNDTSSLTDLHYRRSHGNSSPTNSLENWDDSRRFGHYNALSDQDEEQQVEMVKTDNQHQRQLQPHQQNDQRRSSRLEEKKSHDPPGTFIDDIAEEKSQIRGGRLRNNRGYNCGRDPSVGGDSARFSHHHSQRDPQQHQQQQPPEQKLAQSTSPYTKVKPRSVSPYVDIQHHPWRQTKQQGQRPNQQWDQNQYKAHQSQVVSNHFDAPFHPQTPPEGWHWSDTSKQAPNHQQQHQHDENGADQWDIEFISPTENGAANCEASSLGNLTGEFDDPPLSSQAGDDDTATNTMNTVDLVAEVKRVWRHVQKYEKKKKQKEHMMQQYRTGEGTVEEDGHYGGEDMFDNNPAMESIMSHFQQFEEKKDVSLDDSKVSDLTSFSRTKNGGGAARTYGGVAPTSRRDGVLGDHFRNTTNQNNVEASPGVSFNASHASTEKDLAFVNDGVDLFYESQTKPSSHSNINNNTVGHPRIPLSHHHKSQPYPLKDAGIPLSHHRRSSSIKNVTIESHRVPDAKKVSIDNLAQPYDMTKSRSTGTALSSKTQKTSNRAPAMSMYAAKHEEVLSGMGSHAPSSPRPEHINSHKMRVEMARKYMKQHGGARFPNARSPMPPSVISGTDSPSNDSEEDLIQQGQPGQSQRDNTHWTMQNANERKHTSFRVT